MHSAASALMKLDFVGTSPFERKVMAPTDLAATPPGLLHASPLCNAFA